MYLLDTNVISELRKARAGKADRHVAAWAAPIPLTQFFVSVITLHELEMGVLLAERRDPRQGRLLRKEMVAIGMFVMLSWITSQPTSFG